MKKMTKTVELSYLAPNSHERFAHLQMDLLQKHSSKNRMLAGPVTFLLS